MELQIPTAEPVMVERQEPLTASLVDHLFLYHKCTKKCHFDLKEEKFTHTDQMILNC